MDKNKIINNNYGINLLKRMGLSEERAKNDTLVIFESRDDNIGIGAKPISDSSDIIITDNNLKIGDDIVILSGKHKDLKGKIKTILNNNCVIILNCNLDEVITPITNISKLNDSSNNNIINDTTITDNNNNSLISKKKLKWIQPNLIVKIISKKYENGKYYNKKGTVIDIIDKYTFQLKIGTTILTDVTEKDIITTIPKQPGSKIKIITNQNTEGIILQFLKSEKQALIKHCDSDTVCKYKFKEICDFTY